MKKVELQEIKCYLEDQLNFVNWRLEHAPKYMNEEDEKEKEELKIKNESMNKTISEVDSIKETNEKEIKELNEKITHIKKLL